MTLAQILAQIYLLYPRADTAWTDDQIVAFLNIEQANIFSELQVEATYDFRTIKDTARYALPADMEIPSIKHVLCSNSANTSIQTGTVTVTAGAKTVTGSGTAFTSAIEDGYIVINDELKIVDTVSSAVALTVTTNFADSAAGVAWYLYATPGEDKYFTEYKYADYDTILTRGSSNSWYKFSNSTADYIGFYPEPSVSGRTIRVVYKPKPVDMVNSVAGLLLSPDLHYKWHNLLVYAAIGEIAGSGSNPDVTIANNYAMKYNAIMRMAKDDRQGRDKPGYTATRNVMRTNNRARQVLSGKSRAFPYHVTDSGDV